MGPIGPIFNALEEIFNDRRGVPLFLVFHSGTLVATVA
jgi:hypothetical protein